MEFSKEFFQHQSREAGAFSYLSFHTQSKNWCFSYALTLDHLFAKLFQKSVFEKILHVHRCHSQFPILNLFLWFLITHHLCSLCFFELPKKKVYYPKLKKIGHFSKKNNSKILDYLTFLNLGVLKNIILRLNNNIEIVRAGKM